VLRKKKIKIAKMLAAIIYIVENERNMPLESFSKLVENSFDVSYEIGGISMMEMTMKCVRELRRSDTE
jgi:hypothetical protein